MTRDRAEWLREEERLAQDQNGHRAQPGSPPDPYGGRDGRDGYSRRDWYAGQDDSYSQPGAHGQPGRYGQPDRCGPADPPDRPDPLGGRDGYARQDRASGQTDPFGQPAPYRAADPFGPPDPLSGRGGYARRDRQAGQEGAFGQPDPFGPPDPLGGRDGYARQDRAPGQTDPSVRPASYREPPAFGQPDPFGRPDPLGQPAPYQEPDPYRGQDAYGQPARHAGQASSYAQPDTPGPPLPRAEPDPYRGRDSNGRQARHAGRDPLGPADAGAGYGHHQPFGQPDPRDQQDPYISASRRYSPSGSPPEAPPSGPYRWRPPADPTGQEYPPPAAPAAPAALSPAAFPPPAFPPPALPPPEPGRLPPSSLDSDPLARGGRRADDRRYAGQESGPAAGRDWREASGEQPVHEQAGWQEPARDPAAWREPARGQAPWPEASGDETGWQQHVRADSGWQEPAGADSGWQEPAGADAGWQEPVQDDASAPEAQHDKGFLPGFGDSGSDGGRGRGRRRRRLRIRWIAPLVAFIIILGALGSVGAVTYRAYQRAHANYTGSGRGFVTVQVRSGENATDLAPRLVSAGVIKATDPFIAAAKDSSSVTGLEPGFFRLHKHMNAALAYALLIKPSSRIQITVTIPEGLRARDIASTLAKKTSIPASDFRTALKNPAALGLPAYAGGSPEGYLFPATYNIQPRATATSILQQMVQSFNQEAAAINLAAAAKTARVTESHLIIVASLVQAEGGRLQDFAKIARVIYNRLNDGMPLQLDSTVEYALNKFGIRATDAQTKVNSPYNTYAHKGLPPGPIDSPGDAAIKAALHPAPGTWRFFVTVDPKTGLTRFTNSQRQFDQFVAELNQNIKNGT